MYLGSNFHSCSIPQIEQRDSLFPFDLIVSCSWSIHLMVQWWSRLYQWFPGMCEMFQTSWGGGPLGIPPHARMHSYYATTSNAIPQIWWVRFLPIAMFIACASPSDDPFNFTEPFPIQQGLFDCSTLPPTHFLREGPLYLMYSDDIVLNLNSCFF